MPTGSRLLVPGLCAVLLLSGCVQRVTQTLSAAPPAPMPTRASDDAPYLQAHLRTGEVVVFSTWTSNGAIVEGEGRRLDANRAVVETGPMRVAHADVAIYETNELRTSPNVTALTILTGVSAALTVYCLVDRKACFGSCPTFYAPAEGGPALMAEGFSGSIAPALEATDVDALYDARPTGRRFEVVMKNEALETHVVRHADLLLVPRPEGGRVWHGPDGFVVGGPPVAPAACAAPEGDCLGALAHLDGDERLSPADSTDLAARETIELLFDAPPEGEQLGLVLGARQSLVTTFLFYQMLAYMGRDVGDWFAHLERRAAEAAAEGQPLPLGLVDGLGGIEVLVQGEDGAWHLAGEAMEHGPLARDHHLVTLPPLPEGPVRVRLRLAKGAWRLDGAALVALGAPVAPIRVPPEAVLHDGQPDADALRLLHDPAETLVTLPGDAYTLVYPLPKRPEGYESFLESRGYYLEWMREEWMAEEDPVALAVLLYSPEDALRRLAPAYKTLEPHMEEAFWNSRYVRP